MKLVTVEFEVATDSDEDALEVVGNLIDVGLEDGAYIDGEHFDGFITYTKRKVE